MKSLQRQYGKVLKKGPGDKANVAVLLTDYEDADKMLTKIIDASKSWRDSWIAILAAQHAQAAAFEELYNPIVGASDGHGHEPAPTEPLRIERTSKLAVAYLELKTDLTEEVNMMDSRVIVPATKAKEHIQPIRKTIKKRENKRLDWERYTDKVNSQSKKMSRSDRENAALAKTKEELERAADDFRQADEHLRETLPPILTASFSIIPHLLTAQILIQNTLLAQYYTILHNYCLEMQFPSPPPPMDDVIAQWAHDHNPVRQQAESISVIAKGQGIRQHLNITSDINGKRPSATSSLSSRNTVPTTSAARVMRIPSHTSQTSMPPTPAAEVAQQPTYPVEKKRPPPPPKKKNLSQYLYAEALYDFTGEGQGDLSFKEGDMIQVVKKTDSTDDWWEGRLNGVLGSFPANYCRIA